MLRRVAFLAVPIGLAATLAGCGFSFFKVERRAAWRDQTERACLAAGLLRASPYVQPDAEIGHGACGIERPLRIAATAQGTVALSSVATLGCSMTVALERWVEAALQPAAYAAFGQPVASLRGVGSYSCRTRNNQRGAPASEHAFGNAIDIAGFQLADGREISVKSGWRGRADEQQFLREAQSAACDFFTTVLAPGSDAAHSDHFHLDLARHNADGTSRYCRPRPLPPERRRPSYDGVPVSSVPAPGKYAQAPATLYRPQAAAGLADPRGPAAPGYDYRAGAVFGPPAAIPAAGTFAPAYTGSIAAPPSPAGSASPRR